MQEMIDVFDGNHNLIGVQERAAVHADGAWHQTFHCWVVGTRLGVRFVILQLRSRKKKNYPDMLDITAAGHLGSGEAPADGVRELEEELGVKVTNSELRTLGIKHDVADEPNGNRNREFAHVFMIRDDRNLEEYVLQEDEVSGLIELPINDGLRLFAGEIDGVICKATRIEGGDTTVFSREVRIADLIPRVDSYYLKVFIMADRFLKGERYLSI